MYITRQLRNARAYTQAQRQAEREALVNTISEKIQNTGRLGNDNA